MGGAVPPLSHTPSWRGAQLGGAQGQQQIKVAFTKKLRAIEIRGTLAAVQF